MKGLKGLKQFIFMGQFYYRQRVEYFNSRRVCIESIWRLQCRLLCLPVTGQVAQNIKLLPHASAPESPTSVCGGSLIVNWSHRHIPTTCTSLTIETTFPRLLPSPTPHPSPGSSKADSNHKFNYHY